MSPLPPRYVVFTDLDGTLLDHRTYSWAAAQPALDELERRSIPLVFCSSKTRAEIEDLRRRLRNPHPFITENGGGVFIPQEYFKRKIPGEIRLGRYHCLALGKPYDEIVEQLQELAAEAGAEVAGFHQMSAREVAANTGLDLRRADLAKRRDFDEPFFFAGSDPRAESRFVQIAQQRGLEVVRGGRFHHLFAGSDKGKAVRRLMDLYRRASHVRMRSVALGDSANDQPMLAAVEHAVLLPGHEGVFDAQVLDKLPRITRAEAPGPEGWNRAILELLQA
ncbi:MAG TPA: HAD-IIB family hydrolase [Terriglobales bacterium]|nr:HAD-IIB family hydrolase [Terriglobales bacterium]